MIINIFQLIKHSDEIYIYFPVRKFNRGNLYNKNVAKVTISGVYGKYTPILIL
jgi:hypothetical protein